MLGCKKRRESAAHLNSSSDFCSVYGVASIFHEPTQIFAKQYAFLERRRQCNAAFCTRIPIPYQLYGTNNTMKSIISDYSS